MIELDKYCGDDGFRTYLSEPFTVGEFSYATDGRIIVRVPKRDDVPGTVKIGIAIEAPFKGIDKAQFGPLPHKPIPPLPPSTEQDCDECDGRKTEHDCPDCECPCHSCNGTGLEIITPQVSTTIRGGIFNLKYVALMLELPGVLVQSDWAGGAEEPMFFKFDGGDGAIIPRRSKCEQHVEIEADKAA